MKYLKLIGINTTKKIDKKASHYVIECIFLLLDIYMYVYLMNKTMHSHYLNFII